MKTSLWQIDFDNEQSVIVSTSTILMAIKNAVWGYNKDSLAPKVNSSNIVKVVKRKRIS